MSSGVSSVDSAICRPRSSAVTHPAVCCVETKAQRPDQPQLGTDCCTGASDVPGVLRDIRLMQDHVQQRLGGHCDTLVIQIQTFALPIDTALISTGAKLIGSIASA